MSEPDPSPEVAPVKPKRRVRYSGKNPRRFEDKYKERDPERYAADVAKVIASGKTPAGTHRPIMVQEILDVLQIQPGMRVVDCTLGYGGHAGELLKASQPGGKLLGLDQDPIELPKTEARLRALGFPDEALEVRRINYAGIAAALAGEPVDAILADLGLSSMQIDDPARGFTFKVEAPLDMRMNPQRGQPASILIAKAKEQEIAQWLTDYSDEPQAARIASAIAVERAVRPFATGRQLADFLRGVLRTGRVKEDEVESAVRRVFQAIRIAVNDELGALDMYLRQLPQCLTPGGRVAILTFHSGEDRRVKQAFRTGLREGLYSETNDEVVRASAEEQRSNPRSCPAKLRWAVKA